MIPAVDIHLFSSLSFPRVSGDDPSLDRWDERGEKFSPRERG